MREKFKEWMIIGLVIATIALFPVCGATFHFLVRASLAKQQMLDTEGVPIAARLVNKRTERNVHLDRAGWHIAKRHTDRGDLSYRSRIFRSRIEEYPSSVQ